MDRSDTEIIDDWKDVLNITHSIIKDDSNPTFDYSIAEYLGVLPRYKVLRTNKLKGNKNMNCRLEFWSLQYSLMLVFLFTAMGIDNN